MNKIKIRVLKIYLYLKKKIYIHNWLGWILWVEKNLHKQYSPIKKIKSNQIKRIPSNKDEQDEFASLR